MIDFESVEAVIRESEAQAIAPRFMQLADSEVEEKSPGEIVTIADRECEQLLTPRLTAISDVPVIGEEATAANPALLNTLRPDSTCWLVDPLDGTANFANGSPDYAVMVAYVQNGETVASWMWVPATGEMFRAECGAGATCNGEPLQRPQPPPGIDSLVGVVKTRFLPDEIADHISDQSSKLGGSSAGTHCAGIEYPQLVRGEIDFILYWRTLPWDHAPGVLLASEADCAATRPDGSGYLSHQQEDGLLIAPRSVLEELRPLLIPDLEA